MLDATQPPLLRPSDISKRTGIGLATVYRLIVSGDLEAVDISSAPDAKRRRYGVTEAALSDWMQRRTTTPAPSAMPRRRRSVPKHA